MAADGGILMRHGAVGFALMVLAFASANLTPAGVNGGVIALAEAQVYARDQNFHYAMQPDEPLQKASRLITDKRFLLHGQAPAVRRANPIT
jgi:hypothetical protein